MTLPTPTLETERLRLRPFTDGDADNLFALQSDAYVLRYWDSPPWTDRASIARFMTECQQMADDGSGARVANEQAVGVYAHCGFTVVDRSERDEAGRPYPPLHMNRANPR